MLQDLRFAVRALARRPGFLLVAVLTLGLGIGAVATVFSVVHGVLLRPLPYRAPERLAVLWHEFGEGAQLLPALHALDYRDYRERSRLLEELTIATGQERILGGPSGPELVDVGRVASNFFPFLGVDPAFGRHFREDEDVAGGPNVVLLSHRLWQRRYGGDAEIVGRTLELGGEPHEVVGVLPDTFRLLLPAEAFRLKDSDVWKPARIDYAQQPPRNFTAYTVLARLRPGVSFPQAQEELSGLAAQLRREHAVHAASNLRATLVPFQGDVVKGARRALVLLLAAVGCVLLIACGNVAQLMLFRGRSRERELLVRAAVGAGRWRIARTVLAESLLIAAGGALLGVALAEAGLALVKQLAAASVPRLEAVAVGTPVLVTLVATAALAALVAGAVPALEAARTNVASGLKERGGAGDSRRQGRARDALVVAQVALSLVLVVGTGLLVQSFVALAQAQPGFDPRGRLTFKVALPAGAYDGPEALRAAHDELRARLQRLPGVGRVASVSLLPLSGSGPLQPYAWDAETARHWESVSADHRWVSPGFFDAIGARLVAGRDFTAQDLVDGKRRIVIDVSLARKAFGDRDPVGLALQVEPDGGPESFAEIVGVVEHLRLHDLTRPLLPQIWSPGVGLTPSFVLHTNVPPGRLASDVRRAVAGFDPGIAVQDVRPLAEIVSEAMADRRLAATLLSAFGAVAVALAAVGVYGLFSFAVSQRRREIAIRMALGDAPRGIRRLVLTRALRMVGASLALGVLGAALVSRFVAALLYGVDPLDPPTYAASVLLLAGVGLVAGWLPAERAARVEPLTVLRSE